MALVHSRRAFIKASSVLALGPTILHMASTAKAGTLGGIGELGNPDANGIRLPAGFSSRVIAVSDQTVPGTGFRWHKSPDGGATFAKSGGGWVYVSNSEESFLTGGGASMVEFNGSGTVVGARRLLSGTNANCAGGPTPWNTWLSCEEIDLGSVWECYPLSTQGAVRRSALGSFKHEAAAVDPVYGHVYLTEDEGDGCLYRFVASSGPGAGFSLASGTLQVAKVAGNGAVTWANVPRPNPGFFSRRTRHQVSGATKFNGGEGCWYHDGIVYFTTKGDNRVWSLDTVTQFLTVIYDRATSTDPVLSGVDNVTVSSTGDILVGEDGGDMQIVVIDGDTLEPKPLLQVVGQTSSEITGPAFSPDGSRLYFSSQRGNSSSSRRGITYEVSGPF